MVSLCQTVFPTTKSGIIASSYNNLICGKKIRLHDVQQIGIYFNQFAIPVHSEVWESTHSTDDCSSIEAFGHICPAAHHGCC